MPGVCEHFGVLVNMVCCQSLLQQGFDNCLLRVKLVQSLSLLSFKQHSVEKAMRKNS